MKYATDRLAKESGDRYVFQCTNCSKAFRRSEYLENHIQRRHGKSLADNGIFPLIEQIKRYNSGLFVESSSIDDLKGELKNLQSCLRETSEDLIKERIAREQLQRIIESEIIEKLNSLQATWLEPTSKDQLDRSNGDDGESVNNLNEKNEQTNQQQINNHQLDHPPLDQQLNDSLNAKESQDFNLFLTKQNELIEKLGQNIDRFVGRNDETKLNDKQLETFISTTIHKEIVNVLMDRELMDERKATKDGKETKDNSIKSKKANNRRFLMNKKDLNKSKEDELSRPSLHEFSIQNHLNNGLNMSQQPRDHTNEIVHEINRIISDETLTKHPKTSFTSKIRKFPFKFRKSKSLIQLSADETVKNATMKDEQSNKSEMNELNKDESKTNELEKADEKVMISSNDKTISNNDRTISRFRQFVWKKSDGEDTKISLNKFSSRSNGAELTNETTDKQSDDANKSTDTSMANGKSIDAKTTNDTNVKQLVNQASLNESASRTLKSVLKKSNSTDANLQQSKMPKKIAFSDERIEFSAEELDSSDTGSSHSFSGNTDYTLQPTEQVVTIQKVIERPIPAPRFIQQKTLTSL